MDGGGRELHWPQIESRVVPPPRVAEALARMGVGPAGMRGVVGVIRRRAKSGLIAI